jgi:hypothetical protein
MALNRRRRTDPDRLHAEALLEWYSPYDLDPRAPYDQSRSWNNYVVLALNGYPVSAHELLEHGFIRWGNGRYRDLPRPRHRPLTPGAYLVDLSQAEAAQTYPIFAPILSDFVYPASTIAGHVHLSHWVENFRPDVELGFRPRITVDELCLLVGRMTIEAGHLAVHGYFLWATSAFVDHCAAPTRGSRGMMPSESARLRAMRNFPKGLLAAQELIQDDNRLPPFLPSIPIETPQYGHDDLLSPDTLTMSQDDVSSPAIPLTPRIRLASRRVAPEAGSADPDHSLPVASQAPPRRTSGYVTPLELRPVTDALLADGEGAPRTPEGERNRFGGEADLAALVEAAGRLAPQPRAPALDPSPTAAAPLGADNRNFDHSNNGGPESPSTNGAFLEGDGDSSIAPAAAESGLRHGRRVVPTIDVDNHPLADRIGRAHRDRPAGSDLTFDDNTADPGILAGELTAPQDEPTGEAGDDRFGAAWITAHLGAPSLPRWESIQDFNLLRDAILADIRPRNGIEAILAKDFIEAEWELRRLRTAKEASLRESTVNRLTGIRPDNMIGSESEQKSSWVALIRRYVNGDVQATEELRDWLRLSGLTLEGATSSAFLYALPEIRALELVTASCMFRRNSALNTLMKMRGGGQEQLNSRLPL